METPRIMETPRKATLFKKEVVEDGWKGRTNGSPPAARVIKDDGSDKDDELLYARVEDVEQWMKEDGLDEYLREKIGPVDLTDSKDIEKVIVYHLYGRLFDFEKSKCDRIKRIKEFFGVIPTKPDSLAHAKNTPMNRMIHYLSLGRDRTEETMARTWDYCQEIVLRYAQLDYAMTIFDDTFNDTRKGKCIPFVLRVQVSQNCYLHAISTLVGYLIARGMESAQHATLSIDIDKYARHYLNHDALYNRVVKDTGGSSYSTLCNMISQDDVERLSFKTSDHDNAAILVQKLDKYGPAIISRFKTDDLFHVGFKALFEPGQSQLRFHQLVQFDVVDGEEKAKLVDIRRFDDKGEQIKDKSQIEEAIRLKKASCAEAAGRSKAETTAKESVALTDNLGDAPTASMSFDTVQADSFALSLSSEESRELALELASDTGSSGMHAMVIIGHRKEEKEGVTKVWFLVQNSSASLPVLEASAEYLSKHVNMDGEGGYCFVVKPLTQFPDSVPFCQGFAHESSYDEGEDCVGFIYDGDY
jgi:hypothetical protein